MRCWRYVKREIPLSLRKQCMTIAPPDFVRINIMPPVTGFFFFFCMIPGFGLKRVKPLNVQPTKGSVFVKLDSLVKL